jgi:pseudaminic acid synthase
MLKIKDRALDSKSPPYIIAELSANHNGSLDRAKLSIKIAKECGVDAVKIQTYNPDTMTIDCDKDDFIIKDGLWNGYKLYKLYEEAHTPFEWHSELYRYANEIGITLFSTPFDETAVDLLETLNTPAYKIASFELTDLPLISYVAKKGKPMLISTGMASENEISEALETARSSGCNSLLLFHCISSYPAPIEQANIKQILNLKKTFNVSIGLSDHTIGNTTAIASIALGACAIEKHFTINRQEKGPDSEFSVEPSELKELVKDTKNAWKALGNQSFSRPKAELSSKMFRRSIYFVSDIKSGEKIKETDIRRIRPGFGLPPKYFDKLIGKTLIKDVKRGEAVSWNVILDSEDY